MKNFIAEFKAFAVKGNVIDFLIVALVIFMVLKVFMRLQRKQEEAPAEEKPAEPSEEVKLLREIRDTLRR